MGSLLDILGKPKTDGDGKQDRLGEKPELAFRLGGLEVAMRSVETAGFTLQHSLYPGIRALEQVFPPCALGSPRPHTDWLCHLQRLKLIPAPALYPTLLKPFH